MLKILIVESVPGDSELELAILRNAGIVCEDLRVETQADFSEKLSSFNPDLVLCEYALPAFNGLSALATACAGRPGTPFLVVSNTISEERVVEALKNGATDYVTKSRLARLPEAVVRAVRDSKKRKRAARLESVRSVRSAIATALIRGSPQQELFQAACNVAVDRGRFLLACVGRVAHNAATLDIVAWSGHNEGYLDEVAQRTMLVSGDCPSGREQLKRGDGIVINDILNDRFFVLKAEALARGYRSMMALPLISENKVMALFKIYADEPDFFGPEEREVLIDLAGDLSIAIDRNIKEERLSKLAYYDALTGLANRQLLHEYLRRELARAHRQKTMVAVVFLDLDNLKTVNDTLGHNAGDRLLREISGRILSCTREGDVVARLGGDEFVMVLPVESDLDTVSVVTQRVSESVSRIFRIGNQRLNVSCSIGVAVYPHDGSDSTSLLQNADAAMYQAKKLGRSNIHFCEQTMPARSRAGMRRLLAAGGR